MTQEDLLPQNIQTMEVVNNENIKKASQKKTTSELILKNSKFDKKIHLTRTVEAINRGTLQKTLCYRIHKKKMNNC